MAIININYEGGGFDYDNNGNRSEILSPIKYMSVYISDSKDKKYKFDSGDFIKDWYYAKKKFITELSDTEPWLGASSSVDHFMMDGAKFDSAYLHIDGETPILKYIDRSDEKWYLKEDVSKGVEFFVEENTTPTWEELKKYCGDVK